MSSSGARKGRLISSAGCFPARRCIRSGGHHRGRTLAWRGTGFRGAPGKAPQYLQTVLASLPVLPYTELTAYEHARIWAELESAGQMIGFYDVIVAATALERGSDVATFNRRHFAQVKGLTVIEPE